MGLFNREKQDNSKIWQEIMNLSLKFVVLEKEMQVIKTNMHSLRGMINRKVMKNGDLEPDEEFISQDDPATMQRKLMGFQ